MSSADHADHSYCCVNMDVEAATPAPLEEVGAIFLQQR